MNKHFALLNDGDLEYLGEYDDVNEAYGAAEEKYGSSDNFDMVVSEGLVAKWVGLYNKCCAAATEQPGVESEVTHSTPAM